MIKILRSNKKWQEIQIFAFQTAERQMQELLFGTSQSSQQPASAYSVQKPKPVRPSATSAFSVYSPGSAAKNNKGSLFNALNSGLCCFLQKSCLKFFL